MTSTTGSSYSHTASGRSDISHNEDLVVTVRFHVTGAVSIEEVASDGTFTDVTGNSSAFTDQVCMHPSHEINANTEEADFFFVFVTTTYRCDQLCSAAACCWRSSDILLAAM